jgi:hypothetical protein
MQLIDIDPYWGILQPRNEWNRRKYSTAAVANKKETLLLEILVFFMTAMPVE